MPIHFDKSKRYINKNGHQFGKGVWIDDKGKLMHPGESYKEDSKDGKEKVYVTYNSDGTRTVYNTEEWIDKSLREHEFNVVRNDRKFAIPDQGKRITITIDKNSPTRRNAGASFPISILDSIRVNAQKAGLPFSTAIGIASQESTFGQGNRSAGRSPMPWARQLNATPNKWQWKENQINYDGVYSPTLLISNWKQRDENPLHEFRYDGYGQLLEKRRDDDYYEDNFNAARNRRDHYQLEEESPLEHGFRKYKEDPTKYNPGDKHYPEKVEAQTKELVNYSPEIRAYMKQYHLHGEGGFLNQPKGWDDLSLKEKADVMAVAVRNGVTALQDIRDQWNEFAEEQLHQDNQANQSDGSDQAYQDYPLDTVDSHVYGGGGYIPSKAIKEQIATWEGDSMRTNRSFEEEAKDFNRVIPQSIREKLNQEQLDALYSYGYNVGMGNLKKRVLPILTDYVRGQVGAADVASNMWAGKDSLLKGLAKRRDAEKRQFISSSPWDRQQSIVDRAIKMDLSHLPKNSTFNTPLLGPVVNPTTTLLTTYPTKQEAVKTPEMPAFMKEEENPLLHTLLQGYMADTSQEESTEPMEAPRGLFMVRSYGEGGRTDDDEGSINPYFGYDEQYGTTFKEDVPLQEVVVKPTEEQKKQALMNGTSVIANPNFPMYVYTNGYAKKKAAKDEAAFRQEHPNLAAWRDAAKVGAVTYVTWPFMAAGAAALAGSTAGKMLTSGLTTMANTARNSTWFPWADAAMTSYFGAHGLNDISQGKFTPETALEVAPLVQVARPVAKMFKPLTYEAKTKPAISTQKEAEAPFVSELDWSPESWFGTRVKGAYDAEDVAALQSHVPEYLDIERKAKVNGTWLKMPDGSTWKGDPRSWVQMQSQAYKNAGLTGVPHYSGIDLRTHSLDYTPEYAGDSWTDLDMGMSKNWSGIGIPGYDGYIFHLDYPATAKEYAVDAGGAYWNNLPSKVFLEKPNIYEKITDNLVEQAAKHGYDVTKIDNVVEGFSDGKPVTDIIIHSGTPRKSLLGNNGNFNLLDKNIYRGLIPLGLIGLGNETSQQ